MRFYIFIFLVWSTLACQPSEVVLIERIDSELDSVLSTNATIEILADRFEWSEGPLWVESEQMLLFSDVPKNTIYKWTKSKGLETYLTPAGYTRTEEGNGGEGSNGLLLNSKNQLVICQHGDRRMAVMNTPVSSPSSTFLTLADRYNGKRFNSPNDAVFRSNGDLFFTDPPYGLLKQETDPLKELPQNGVYRLDSAGSVTLLVDSLTRPNGITFINNEKTLLVANSDPAKAKWYAYDLTPDNSLTNGRTYTDATENTKSEIGLPDGLKVNKKGYVFATGPGGVWIFNASGKVIGKIKTNVATANCALGKNEKELFLTSDQYLIRIELQ